MVSRILSFLLGALLTAVGWAIIDPKGLVGAKLPGLEQLGMFEGHRVFIGWGAVALGVVALLAAVGPKDQGKRRRGPPAVDFDADPAPSVEDVSYTPSQDAADGDLAPSMGGRAPSPLW